MSESPLAVEVTDVHKSFDRGVIQALDGVSLSIAQGEFVAITGPSGCGKSTLLHLIGALDRPTSGRVVVNGIDIADGGNLDRFRRNQIGLIFQFHDLLAHLSATQNVEIPMFGTHRDGKQREARARELLVEVDLAGQSSRRPTELSGGERQRVAIARALVTEPSLLLADEPTGNLDSATGEEIIKLFEQLHAAGHTLVLVTHEPAIAARCPRAVRLMDGKVVSDGPGAQVALESRAERARASAAAAAL
jgi:putative ABC transport system ATP-binding protein